MSEPRIIKQRDRPRGLAPSRAAWDAFHAQRQGTDGPRRPGQVYRYVPDSGPWRGVPLEDSDVRLVEPGVRDGDWRAVALHRGDPEFLWTLVVEQFEDGRWLLVTPPSGEAEGEAPEQVSR
jgi:hypothetical protein